MENPVCRKTVISAVETLTHTPTPRRLSHPAFDSLICFLMTR